MSRLLFDGFDTTTINVTADSTASAQTSSASVRATNRVTVAGVANPQTSAAIASVSGEAAIPHHDAPAPRFLRAGLGVLVRTAPPKDPSDVLDYTISFAALLESGEVIASSAWSFTGGDGALVKGTGSRIDTFGESSSTLWLSAGTAQTEYLATCHITTSHSPPREFERSFSITVADL